MKTDRWNAVSIVLAARPRAVGLARDMVTEAVTRWALAQLAEDATLVVSELVSNAVSATGSLAEWLSWDQLKDVGMIKVQAVRGQACVLVEVWDSAPAALPEVSTPLPGAESGRGLVIVEALSAAWGCYPANGGKVVWAQCALEAPDCIPGSAGRNLEDIPGSMALPGAERQWGP